MTHIGETLRHKSWRMGNTEGREFVMDTFPVLGNVLWANLGIVTTINHDKKFFRLRVAQSSMAKLIGLVRPYIIPSMLYKFSP